MSEDALLLGQIDSILEYTAPNGQCIRVVQEFKLSKPTTVSMVGTALQRSIYSAVLIFAKEAANVKAQEQAQDQHIPESGSPSAGTERSSPERLLDVDGPDGT
jgi:hypothetical protein